MEVGLDAMQLCVQYPLSELLSHLHGAADLLHLLRCQCERVTCFLESLTVVRGYKFIIKTKENQVNTRHTLV